MRFSMVEASVDALFYLSIFFIVIFFLVSHIIPPFKSLGNILTAGFSGMLSPGSGSQAVNIDKALVHLPQYINFYALITSWDFLGVMLIVGVLVSMRYLWKKNKELEFYG